MNNFGSFGNYSKTVDPMVKSLPANFMLYALATLVIVFIGFMLMNKSVVPPNPLPYLIPRSMIVYSSSKRIWTPSGNTRNLVAYKSDIGSSFQDNSYSILMECKLLDSRSNSAQPVHRHIFHRGSDEYSANPSASANTAGGNLPRRMNPGVFLDPLTNDLLVFVDTVNGSQSFRESLRVPDLPLKTPFRLGIVVSNRTLDVYINCRLEDTKLLQGTPKPVEMTVYGEAGSNPAPLQLQNVYLWSNAITTADMTSLCGSAPSFIDSAAVCSTLPPPPAPDVGTSLNNVPLGNVLQSALGSGYNQVTDTIFGRNTNNYG
jgi:hypothetical protein